MPNASTPQPPNRNWIKHFESFFSPKNPRIKGNKFASLLYFIITRLGAVLTVIAALSPFFQKGCKGNKSQDLIPIVREKPTLIVKNVNELFSKKNLFYQKFDGSEMEDNEVADVIELSNEEIYVHVSPINSSCGDKYAIVKMKSFNELVYGFMPAKNYQNRGPIQNWLNMDLEPTKKEIEDDEGCYINTSQEEMVETRKFSNPGLEIKINNLSANNMLIHDLQVMVKKSLKNTFPYLAFELGTGFEIPIYNEGGGEARNIIMNFNLIPTDEKFSYNKPLKYKMKLASLKPTTNDAHFYHVDTKESLRSFFQKEGVKTELIDTLDYDRDSLKTYYKRGWYGKFKDGAGRAVGKIIYDGKLPSGAWQRDTLNFNFITLFQTPGIGGDYSIDYESLYEVKLRPIGENYKIPIGTSVSIAPNSAGKVKISFSSGLSSYHLFDLKLLYNNNDSIVIHNIFLNEFIENSHLRLIKSKKAVAKFSKKIK